MSTPQPLLIGEREEDTLFAPTRRKDRRRAVRPTPPIPACSHVGHYLGTPPQATALAVDGPVRGRATAGMDTALLAYSGISIKMLVDPTLGANLLTMFTVDYEPGGAAQVHDHPFEEAYLFLEGEIEGEVDGKHHVFRAGELLFCGVGVVHGFFNTSGGRVRWIETQAPQPPRRNSYRWPAHWARLREEFATSPSALAGPGSTRNGLFKAALSLLAAIRSSLLNAPGQARPCSSSPLHLVFTSPRAHRGDAKDIESRLAIDDSVQ